MFKLRNVIILFVVLLLVWSIGSQVQATNLIIDLTNFSATNEETADSTTNVVANETTNTTANEETQVVQPNTNTNTSGSTNNDLPQTGVTEDITVMFFIVVCVIAAIYAYKKIRDYKS